MAGLSAELDEFRTPKPGEFLKGYCSPMNASGLNLKEITDEEIEGCMNNSYLCDVTWLEFYDPLGSIIVDTDGDIWIDEVFSENPLILEEGYECVYKNGTIRPEWLKEMNNRCSLEADCGVSNNFLKDEGHINEIEKLVDRSDFDTEDWILETASINWGSAGRLILSISMPWLGGGSFSNAIYLRRVKETVTFTCEPWQAPRGGENCEVCNQQDIPCTEYQCHSLGQGCDTINDENGNLFCYHNNQDEPVPPIITLIDDLPVGFEYSDPESSSPPDLGVNIIHPEQNPGNENPIVTKNCIPPYTPFDIKIHTNELANCRYDVERISPVEHPDDFFDLMEKKFNHNSANMYNHTASFMIPNPEYVEEVYNLTISPGEEYTIFVRCMDGNGNANKAEFEVKFCIDDGPDQTVPWIAETSIDNGAFIGYDQTSAEVIFTTTEPADCKWSHLDKIYGEMENEMACIGYECKTTLTGLISNSNTAENKFYVRCIDQPNLAAYPERTSDRNIMQTSYLYTLYGSLPLGIKSAIPNNTKLSGPTDEIEVELAVETFAGAENGKATCYYDGVDFLHTNAITHTQPGLRYKAGPHTIEIKCIDAGGNTVTEEITFEVEEDMQEPTVVRAFYDSGYIRLITDEVARCAYSTVDCTFSFEDSDITNITAFNTFDHLVVWNPDSDLYVKCKDKYDRYLVGDCSIILRASDYFGQY
jgi:hypothetical protein